MASNLSRVRGVGSNLAHLCSATPADLLTPLPFMCALPACPPRLPACLPRLPARLPAAPPPCRDSKLTRILEDSLGGNCKTTFMAMVSPAVEAFAGGWAQAGGWWGWGQSAALWLALCPARLHPNLPSRLPACPAASPPAPCTARSASAPCRVAVHPQVCQPRQVHAQPAKGGAPPSCLMLPADLVLAAQTRAARAGWSARPPARLPAPCCCLTFCT